MAEDGQVIKASRELMDSLDALANMVYLIRMDRNDPAKVLTRTRSADGLVQEIYRIVNRRVAVERSHEAKNR
jgi:hypothetical protein